jgi:predicted lipid-binding transport protein (Tim44 family)
MGVSGSFPIDLILFGMIAAFLVLRLRSILGRRTGFERPPQQAYTPPQARSAGAPVVDGPPQPVAEPVNRTLPDPASPIGLTLTRMRSIDASFEPAGFLRGAEQAFRIIVTAFAGGDRTNLRALLADDTYAAFEQVITAREAEGQTQISEIRSIQSTAINAAELVGSVATVTVLIVSDQVNLTNDKNGNPVAGAEAVTEISDLWSFERDLAQPDPTWRLVAARSA